MASTGALTVVATVRFSRTHLDTLIINAGRTEQWWCSNGVAWHGRAGRQADMPARAWQKRNSRGLDLVACQKRSMYVGVTGR